MCFSGVFDAKEVTLILIEGNPFTLHVNPDDIKGAFALEWMFNDTIIAEIAIEVNTSKQVQYPDKKIFRDRLKMNEQSGSLTIKNIRTTDSGLYKLQIRAKSKESIKTFRVFVSGE